MGQRRTANPRGSGLNPCVGGIQVWSNQEGWGRGKRRESAAKRACPNFPGMSWGAGGSRADPPWRGRPTAPCGAAAPLLICTVRPERHERRAHASTFLCTYCTYYSRSTPAQFHTVYRTGIPLACRATSTSSTHRAVGVFTAGARDISSHPCPPWLTSSNQCRFRKNKGFCPAVSLSKTVARFSVSRGVVPSLSASWNWILGRHFCSPNPVGAQRVHRSPANASVPISITTWPSTVDDCCLLEVRSLMAHSSGGVAGLVRLIGNRMIYR